MNALPQKDGRSASEPPDKGTSSKEVLQIGQAASSVGKALDTVLSMIGDFRSFTGSVRSLSSQTQSLAINAAIEAAQAGQAGKSFSVIAREIDVLSSRSKEASREITATIEAIERHLKKIKEDQKRARDHLLALLSSGTSQRQASPSEGGGT